MRYSPKGTPMHRAAAASALLLLAAAAPARSLSDIGADINGLEVQDQNTAPESDCRQGLTLLGVTMASGGGIYALREGHPASVALQNAMNEASPFDSAAYRAGEDAKLAARTVQKQEQRVADLDKEARGYRENARKKRERAEATSDKDTQRSLYADAEDWDRKAAEVEETARKEADKLAADQNALNGARAAQAAAEAAAAPYRARYDAANKQVNDLAKKCAK